MVWRTTREHHLQSLAFYLLGPHAHTAELPAQEQNREPDWVDSRGARPVVPRRETDHNPLHATR
eukprot:12890501-Prorocentrum_lima.AAC.1